MIFTFAITIVGVNINYHICGESGNETVEAYLTPNCDCEEDSTESTIPIAETADCCSEHSNTPKPVKAVVTSDCCKSFTTTFAINDEFINFPINLDKLFVVNSYEISDIFELNLSKSVDKVEKEVKNIIFLPLKTLIKIIHLTSFKGISNPDDIDKL